MREKEISSQEKNEEGNPGEISKYLRHHSDGKEKTLKGFVYLIFLKVKSHLFPVKCGGNPSSPSFHPQC